MRKSICVLVFCTALLLNCGGGGNSTAPVPYSDYPTISASASPSIINQGDNTTLTWTTTNADRVEISSSNATPVAIVGSPSGVITLAPTETTTYTLTAYGVKTAQAAVLVTVIQVIVPPPPPPPPPPVIQASVTVQWDLPTTYIDNTIIGPADIAEMVVLVYMKSTNDPFLFTDQPVATSLPGATEVTFGPMDVNRGATYYFSVRARMANGLASDFMIPSATCIWN